MDDEALAELVGLDDKELLTRVEGLARRERHLTALMIAHLVELDRRGVVLRQGYSGLFVYCRDGLGMSENEAYNRWKVAEAARRYPAILDELLRGEVTLTAVRLVAPHLTEENHAGVLASLRGRRKADVEVLVASLAPRPDAPAIIRKLPCRAPTVAAAPAPPAVPAAPALPRPSAPTVAATAPDRYRLQLTVDRGTVDLLRELKDLLRHAVPSGDDAEIVRRALALLLEDARRKKFSATSRPRSPQAPAGNSIPAAVQRAVWARDGGQCSFVGPGSHRCGERSFLELHHRHPRGMGGLHAADNVALRCRAHNRYEAEVDYGRRLPRRSGTAANAGAT